MISNMGLLRNSDSMEGFNSSTVDGMMPLSDQGFSHHHDHQLPPPIFNHEIAPRSLQNFDLVAADDFVPAGQGGLCNNMSMMMMMMMTTMPEPDQTQQMTLSSPSVSGTGVFDPTKGSRKNNQLQLSGKKRKRMSELEKEKKHREVVHVRAKRGQATDSHSLAERLRREKINEKLRCLQDLVPGCYKTMGMAVMLDVTINYVRSLQNQIDFLSTKLSAASLFYDFNSPLAEAMETIQQGTNEHEAAAAQGMEKQIGGEAYGESSHFQPAADWPF